MRARHIEIKDEKTVSTLKKLKKEGKSLQERVRSHAILLSHDGMRINEIAKVFDVTGRTVYNWFNAWDKEGLGGLMRREGGGRKPAFNDSEHKEVIARHIADYPHQPKKAYALTLEELDIEVSYKTFTRFLKKHFD